MAKRYLVKSFGTKSKTEAWLNESPAIDSYQLHSIQVTIKPHLLSDKILPPPGEENALYDYTVIMERKGAD